MVNHCCMCDDNRNHVANLESMVREMADIIVCDLGWDCRDIIKRPDVKAVLLKDDPYGEWAAYFDVADEI